MRIFLCEIKKNTLKLFFFFVEKRISKECMEKCLYKKQSSNVESKGKKIMRKKIELSKHFFCVCVSEEFHF